MTMALLHRRLAIAMGITALVAFSGGAGFEPLSAILAGTGLLVAIFWQPDTRVSLKLEQLWLPLAFILVLRSLYHVFLVGDDVVIPVVDLLLLLMCAEALRSLDVPNDVRLYALSFALLLASTAYRPGLLFAVAFVIYAALATVGLTVGHLKRQAEVRGLSDIAVGRRFFLRMSVLSGVVLMTSAIVFIAFPRISRGWAARGELLATSIAGFADEVSIGSHGSRIYPNPEIVLRVEFPQGRPANMTALQWRGRSYDRFDGVRWTRSSNLPSSVAPTRWYEGWGEERVLQRIFAAPLDVKVIFALHPVVSVQSDTRQIATLFDNAGDRIYWGSGQPTYDALSVGDRPSPDALRQATSGFRPARSFYTQLPRLPQRIHDLARDVTLDLDNEYDRVVTIERFLRTEFEYTLDLPRSAREATLEAFLFERRAGHCEYFSTAMVVMLRSLGIGARQVNGFLGGQWNQFGEYLAVTQNEAHSWAEVWFPGYGWVPFDPTPSRVSGSAESLQSWMWPGRFLLDGIRHRWNKWVLDYNIDSQSDFLRRVRQFFGGQSASAGEATEAPKRQRRSLWIGALITALLLGLVWGNARGPRYAKETRLYLQLRHAYESAGLPTRKDLAPMDLVDVLKVRRHPAVGSAELVVDHYLRARFGGASLTASERQDMAAALGVARRSMRRHGRG
jgi:protein-glutamine gamma-glutamyltransferase